MQLSRAVNPSPIKSIQRGVITLSSATGTATVSAVNTAKSFLNFLGCTPNGTTIPSTTPKLVLTSATQVTANLLIFSGTVDVSWELIEYV